MNIQLNGEEVSYLLTRIPPIWSQAGGQKEACAIRNKLIELSIALTRENKQEFCKECNGFIESGDVPKEEIAKDNWCTCKGEKN